MLALPLPEFMSDDEDAVHLLVDTSRYPIHELDSEAARRLITTCREAWVAKGSVSLPGFIKCDVIGPMCNEVSDLPSFRRLYTASAYTKAFDEKGESFPDSHPAKRLLQMDIHAVAGDQLPRSLMLRKLYDSPQLARFFARVLELEQDQVYQYADPWQCLNVRVLDM